MRSARKLPCEALHARLSRERGPAGGRGGDGGAKDITRRRATHSFSFVFSVVIFSLKFMYSVLSVRYFTRQARMNPMNCSASTRDQMPSTRDHLPETRFVLFYTFFADKNRIPENRPLCVALDPCERTKWHGHRNANNSREHIQISAAFDSCEHLRKHGDELTQLLGRVKKNISWSQSNSLCYDSARTQNRHTCDAFCDTLTSRSFPRDECRN